ncbi:MAG TPA: polyprenyl diphosphate synthase [Anaeromyxobacter sp.]
MSRAVGEKSLIEELEAHVKTRPLPRHVAVIMDGNGRWAQARGLPRVAGHREGSESVRAVTRAARRVGVEALTLYAFSSQNWARPKLEVDALMHLLAEYLESERQELLRNQVRLNAIGDLEKLPGFVRDKLESVAAASAAGARMTLTLALSYGGREELVHAARAAAARGGPIDEAALDACMWTAGLPELDLLVRTSGERRISNFLLWQCAYAELYFTDVLWPDFRDAELFQAIADFQGRERRFGLTGAQLAGRAARE